MQPIIPGLVFFLLLGNFAIFIGLGSFSSHPKVPGMTRLAGSILSLHVGALFTGKLRFDSAKKLPLTFSPPARKNASRIHMLPRKVVAGIESDANANLPCLAPVYAAVVAWHLQNAAATSQRISDFCIHPKSLHSRPRHENFEFVAKRRSRQVDEIQTTAQVSTESRCFTWRTFSFHACVIIPPKCQ